MRWRWASSCRARALGHPPGLQGQTRASLSAAAQAKVRQNLTELADHEDGQVPQHRPKDHGLDTFRRELEDLYVAHAAGEGDRAAPAKGPLSHRTDVPPSARSRFIQLAALVLAGLTPLPSGEPRPSPLLRTPRGLSERWKRIKGHVRSAPEEAEEPEDGTAPGG